MGQFDSFKQVKNVIRGGSGSGRVVKEEVQYTLCYQWNKGGTWKTTCNQPQTFENCCGYVLHVICKNPKNYNGYTITGSDGTNRTSECNCPSAVPNTPIIIPPIPFNPIYPIYPIAPNYPYKS